MSVYSNEMINERSDAQTKDTRRLPRTNNSGISNDLNNITKEHKEMRTSSATAGNTGTEYKLLNMTSGAPGLNNLNITNQNQQYHIGNGNKSVTHAIPVG